MVYIRSVPLLKDSQKYVRFQWGKKLYKSLCLCFGFIFSPIDLYKTYESSNISYEEIEYFDYSLSGRHCLNWTFAKRNDSCLAYIDFSITKSRISEKCQKVSLSNLSEDTVPVSYCRFKRNDPIPSTGKGFGNNRTMSHISYKRSSFWVREISQLIGKLCFSAIAVLSASLQYRSLQRQQIFEFSTHKSLEKKFICHRKWGKNFNGRFLISN